MDHRIKPLVFAAAVASATAATAQVQQHPAEEMATQVQSLESGEHKAAAQAGEKRKKADFLIVPIPMSNPVTGSGLTLAAVAFYNPNGAPQPWVSGGGAMYTETGTKGIGLFHSMSLGHDKFRLIGVAGYVDAKINFYGVGPNAGARNVSIDMEDKAYIGLVQGQVRLFPHVYAGARYEYLNVDSSIEIPHPDYPDLQLPPLEAKSTLSMLGPALTYDSRDSSTNPRRGALVNATWLFGLKGLGSDFAHNKFELQANAYVPVAAKTGLAARAAFCGASTKVPFYDLCMFGSQGDLRGYEAGRYRDRGSWAVQAEVRQHLFWRIGMVAFADVGGIAPDLASIFDQSTVLASGGVGLRYLASKRSNVNLRLDVAWGKDSHAVYFGIGESF